MKSTAKISLNLDRARIEQLKLIAGQNPPTSINVRSGHLATARKMLEQAIDSALSAEFANKKAS